METKDRIEQMIKTVSECGGSQVRFQDVGLETV
jgi:hypothetical protein